MTQYYRVTDGARRDLTAEQYAALSDNKKATLRLWSVDPMPTPSASQVVIDGGIAVDATTARQTWTFRAKTQQELDAAANALEMPQVLAFIDQWTAAIQAYNPNPDMTGTMAVQAVNLWALLKNVDARVVRNEKALRYLAKREKEERPQ